MQATQKKKSEGCPSNQVSAAAMTSASGEKWRPFNCFFSRVGLRTYQHPCTQTDMIMYLKCTQYLWRFKQAGKQKTMPCTKRTFGQKATLYTGLYCSTLILHFLRFFSCHNEMPPEQLKQLNKADVAFRKPCRSHGYMTNCRGNAKCANAITCHQGAHETQRRSR